MKMIERHLIILIIFCYSVYGDFNVTKLVDQPMISTITGNIGGKYKIVRNLLYINFTVTREY